MPYQGVKCKTGDYLITIKAYEHSDGINKDTLNRIRKIVVESPSSDDIPHVMANSISSKLKPLLIDELDVPFYEVEALYKNGNFFTIYTEGNIKDE